VRDDHFQQDLHPNLMAGQNRGDFAPEPESRGADEIKQLHELLPLLSNEELSRVRVVAVGERLEQGATCVDIRDSGREPFTAMGEMYAGSENLLIAKSETDYPVWNRIVLDPEERARRGAA
jgi:hypothetical protein